MNKPLARVPWLVALAGIVAATYVVIRSTGTTNLDFEQQLRLVHSLQRLELHSALGSTVHVQASPPGYGFFALPFAAALSPIMGAAGAYRVAALAAFGLLLAGTIVASRARGIPPRSGHELAVGLAVVSAAASLACVTESFHPSDLLATALCLVAYAAVVQRRHWRAVVVLGLALYVKQWATVVVGVACAVQRSRQLRLRYAIVPTAIVLGALVPFAVANPPRTIAAVSASSVSAAPSTLLGRLLAPASRGVLALEARILPLALVACLCLWLLERRASTGPAVVAAVLATALLVRPALDPAGYEYYLLPGMAFLAITVRRWWWPLLTWSGGWGLHRLWIRSARPPMPGWWLGAAIEGLVLVALASGLALIVASARRATPADLEAAASD